ncbi:hypothetical protein Dimus_011817 [Dionaea muscipula]
MRENTGFCSYQKFKLASQIEGGEDCLKGIAIEGEGVFEHSDEHHLQLRRTLRRTPPATLANTPMITTSDDKLVDIVMENGLGVFGIPLEMKRVHLFNLHEASSTIELPKDWEGATSKQLIEDI